MKQSHDLNPFLRECFRSDGKPKAIYKTKQIAQSFFTPTDGPMRVYYCKTHKGYHTAKVKQRQQKTSDTTP